jgi:hypothetical protein
MANDTAKYYKKLDNLLANPKSKNFVNHLVHSYFPPHKVNVVDEKPKKGFRCVITNTPLISRDEALMGVMDKSFQDKMMQHIRTMFSEEHRGETPIKEMLNGRVLGFTGKDTTTCISQEGYQIFYDWVVTKILKGDKHINWLVKSIDRQDYLDRAEVLADDDESKKALAQIKKSTNGGRKPLATFGDLDALQQLKAKFEAEEKKK